MQSALLPSADFPTHTPELLALFNEVNRTRVAFAPIVRRNALTSTRSPEYRAAKAAYCAYWAAVDADRAAKVSA